MMRGGSFVICTCHLYQRIDWKKPAGCRYQWTTMIANSIHDDFDRYVMSRFLTIECEAEFFARTPLLKFLKSNGSSFKPSQENLLPGLVTAISTNIHQISYSSIYKALQLLQKSFSLRTDPVIATRYPMKLSRNFSPGCAQRLPFQGPGIKLFAKYIEGCSDAIGGGRTKSETQVLFQIRGRKSAGTLI